MVGATVVQTQLRVTRDSSRASSVSQASPGSSFGNCSSAAARGGGDACGGSGCGEGAQPRPTNDSSDEPGSLAARDVLHGLPLRGCVSEYVHRWGWHSLPQGTQQLLRDILETLQGLGLRYTLEEETTAPASTSASAGAASLPTPGDGPGSACGAAEGSDADETDRVIMRILF